VDDEAADPAFEIASAAAVGDISNFGSNSRIAVSSPSPLIECVQPPSALNCSEATEALEAATRTLALSLSGAITAHDSNRLSRFQQLSIDYLSASAAHDAFRLSCEMGTGENRTCALAEGAVAASALDLQQVVMLSVGVLSVQRNGIESVPDLTASQLASTIVTLLGADGRASQKCESAPLVFCYADCEAASASVALTAAALSDAESGLSSSVEGGYNQMNEVLRYGLTVLRHAGNLRRVQSRCSCELDGAVVEQPILRPPFSRYPPAPLMETCAASALRVRFPSGPSNELRDLPLTPLVSISALAGTETFTFDPSSLSSAHSPLSLSVSLRLPSGTELSTQVNTYTPQAGLQPDAEGLVETECIANFREENRCFTLRLSWAPSAGSNSACTRRSIVIRCAEPSASGLLGGDSSISSSVAGSPSDVAAVGQDSPPVNVEDASEDASHGAAEDDAAEQPSVADETEDQAGPVAEAEPASDVEDAPQAVDAEPDAPIESDATPAEPEADAEAADPAEAEVEDETPADDAVPAAADDTSDAAEEVEHEAPAAETEAEAPAAAEEQEAHSDDSKPETAAPAASAVLELGVESGAGMAASASAAVGLAAAALGALAAGF
jgi:hypothetical protein